MSRLVGILSLVLALGLLGGCASGGDTPGGSVLYDDAGQLQESEIRLETYRPGRTLTDPDLRLLGARDGRVQGQVRTHSKEGEAEVPLDAYGKLWRVLRDGGAMLMEREAPARDGGLYHLVRLRMGTDVHEFSAQERTNFLGVSTKGQFERLDLVNAIAKAVSTNVPTTKRVKGEKTDEGATP
mgnify:CR=1 FL=1